MKGIDLMAQVDNTIPKLKNKRLLKEDRVLIEYMLKINRSKAEISRELCVARSTITKEVRKGTVKQRTTTGKTIEVYLADYAQTITDHNRSKVGRKPKFLQCMPFLEYADDLMLNKKFSPDAVIGQASNKVLALFPKNEMVCVSTLYTYISLGLLKTKDMDLLQKVSRKPKSKHNRVNKKILGQSIDERPAEINERKIFAHWEIDCVLLKRSKEKVLLTLVERLSRQTIIRLLDGKTAACVSQAMAKLRTEYGWTFESVFKSVTADNGSEFAELTSSFSDTSTQVYYAHPFSSWERGTNERNNGMIRRFIPKGFDPVKVTKALIQKVETWLNHYPRKILGYATSFDIFSEQTRYLYHP